MNRFSIPGCTFSFTLDSPIASLAVTNTCSVNLLLGYVKFGMLCCGHMFVICSCVSPAAKYNALYKHRTFKWLTQQNECETVSHPLSISLLWMLYQEDSLPSITIINGQMSMKWVTGLQLCMNLMYACCRLLMDIFNDEELHWVSQSCFLW